MVGPIMETSKSKAWPQIHGVENRRLREQLGDFCQETSFTAIVNIYKASNILKRLAWLVIFLGFFGYLTWQCYWLLDKYFAYPSDVKIELKSVPELQFPSVTICNMNPIRESALTRPPFDQLQSYRKDNFVEENKLYDAARNKFSKSFKIGSPPKQEEQKQDPNQQTTLKNNQTLPLSTTLPTTSTKLPTQLNTTETLAPGTTTKPIQTSTSAEHSTSNDEMSFTNPDDLMMPSDPPKTKLPTNPTNGNMPTDATNGDMPTDPTSGDIQTDPNSINMLQTNPANGDTQTGTSTGYSWGLSDTTSSWGVGEMTTGYFASWSDLFMKQTFNKWDVLDEESVNNFYNTTDTEFDASFKYAVLSALVSENTSIEAGHALKTFMISCKFGGYQCSPKNFTTFHNHKYGNCFTFNHANQKTPVTSKYAGPLHGLALELYLEQKEYLPALSPEAGIRVVVHPRDAMPFPEDEGVSVSPGFATSIGIKTVEMIRLEPPHADCANNGAIVDMYAHNKNYNYSKLSCMKSCYQMLIIDECKCATPILYVEDKSNVCNMTDPHTASCAMNIESRRQTDYELCDTKCPQSCYEKKYEKSMSMAEWPSDVYKEKLNSRVTTSNSNFMGNYVMGAKDFVKLRVYFQEMVVERVENKKSYESMNLISDIGGQLGLWLGLSAITVMEFCSFIMVFIRALANKIISPRTTPVQKLDSLR